MRWVHIEQEQVPRPNPRYGALHKGPWDSLTILAKLVQDTEVREAGRAARTAAKSPKMPLHNDLLSAARVFTRPGDTGVS